MAGPVSVVMIRHARTSWNAGGRIQGRTDIPLDEVGRAQVEAWALPERFSGYAWTSSPLARAMETARLLGARAVRAEPRVSEMSWGLWEGRTLAGLRRELGGAFRRNERRGLDFRPPGGESPRDVQARLGAWLDDVRAAGEPCVVVSHKGVIRALLAMATGWDMRDDPPAALDWGSAHRFELAGGRLRAAELNVPLGARAPT